MLKPGNFGWMEQLGESLNVIEILEYDYQRLNWYAGGSGWKILYIHKYGAPIVDNECNLSNVYDKIRDHMWYGHTDKTFIWSMNIMEYIAKFGWNELIMYTTRYKGWYIQI